jgi:Lrp/AsnC family leucine-responsive transcriptional regulator
MIGERIEMSVSAVIERIKKLEQSGIIKRYPVILDPEAIGKHTVAYIFVNLEHPRYNESFIDSVNRNNEITECHMITGDYDFLIKTITHSTKTLERILDDIKHIEGVTLTRTLVVLRSAKEEFVSI